MANVKRIMVHSEIMFRCMNCLSKWRLKKDAEDCCKDELNTGFRK